MIKRHVSFLLLINILIMATGYALVQLSGLVIKLNEVVIVSLVFSLIAFITLMIFLRGQSKDPASQTFHTLVAISLKFLLEISFALVWFIIAKKISLQSVFIFFVLYLALSLFSIGVIVKTLKNKAL